MDKLKAKLKEWFEAGEITLAIGYKQGTREARPFFCRTAEDVEQMVFSNDFQPNLAVYLSKKEVVKDEKVAIVCTISALRSIAYLARENQIGQSQYKIIHLSPNDELMIFRSPWDIDPYIEELPSTPSEEDRRVIEMLDAMTPSERWAWWAAQFSKCIKCYACRAACPMCYCTRCIVDNNRPQWIDPWASPLSNMEWQINRVMHLAGRCVGCGACGAACPEGIPVHLLNRKILDNIEENFGMPAGIAPREGAVLNTYKPEDKENFIK